MTIIVKERRNEEMDSKEKRICIECKRSDTRYYDEKTKQGNLNRRYF